MTPFERAVSDVIRSIPRGSALTYGEVAEEAGRPGAARAVGALLRKSTGLPWWRVVGSGGRLVGPDPMEQATRLRSEGVAMSPTGRVLPMMSPDYID